MIELKNIKPKTMLFKSISIAFLLLFACMTFSQQLAFPGAEGYGKHSTGGRATNTQVIIVNTLEDVMDRNDGLTSLREAVQFTTGPRIVVFAVGGVFDMTAPTYVGGNWNLPNFRTGSIWINGANYGNLTIAGQTAPSPGVIIRGTGFYIQFVENLIFQYLSIRNVDPSMPGFTPDDVGSQSSNLRIDRNTHHSIFDHITCSWSTDNSITTSLLRQDSYAGQTINHISITNSIIAETDARSSHEESLILEPCRNNPNCLANQTLTVISEDEEYRFGQPILVQNNSCHNPAADANDSCSFGHSMGPRGGSNRGDAIVEKVSWYKNYIAHCDRRNPRFASGKMNWINNVVYNWNTAGIIIDHWNATFGGQYNFIGNYYKTGPQSATDSSNQGSGPVSLQTSSNVYYHSQDNVLDLAGTSNQALLPNEPIPNVANFQDIVVPVCSSGDLVDSPTNDFFSTVGNSHHRDSHDQRIIDEFFSRSGRVGISDDHDRSYPYQDTPIGNYYASVDTDADGMADNWENQNGLIVGVNDAIDFAQDGYLNIEKYIHSITSDDNPVSNDLFATLTATDDTATESPITTGSYSVNLSEVNNTGSAIIVNYSIAASSTATASDYASLSGSVTILNGQQSASITITPINDIDVENDETVVIELEVGNSYLVGSPSSAVVSIESEDIVSQNLELSIDDVTLDEGDSGITDFDFTVSIDGGVVTNTNIDFDFTTRDNTATAGIDYIAVSGTRTIPIGESSTTITVSVFGDELAELWETFFVDLISATGATINDFRGVGRIGSITDDAACDDGILNGDEEYIDCGGQFCTACDECPYETAIVSESPVPDDLNLKTSNWIQSDGNVSSSGNVTLKAANYIELKIEFEVLLGGELFINIEGCN